MIVLQYTFYSSTVYYLTANQDWTFITRYQNGFADGSFGTNPTTDNTQPSLYDLFSNTGTQTCYATYMNTGHNSVNSFHPLQLFSSSLNPEMPPSLLSKAARSLYFGNTGALQPVPYVTPFGTYVPADQVQYQATLKFIGGNFFDAFLNGDDSAREKLQNGNGDISLTHVCRNMK